MSTGALAVATGQATEHTETIDLDQRTVRLLTLSLDEAPDGGALQIGTDVTNMTAGLRRARTGTALAGISAGLGAALMAWLFLGG